MKRGKLFVRVSFLSLFYVYLFYTLKNLPRLSLPNSRIGEGTEGRGKIS
jgi:hypothetical protein